MPELDRPISEVRGILWFGGEKQEGLVYYTFISRVVWFSRHDRFNLHAL
jgi:hypothetical protein